MNVEDLIPLDTLEASEWPAYVLDAGGVIRSVNGAWDREARRAGGPLGRAVIGTRWLDHISGADARAWHDELLERLLHLPGNGRRRPVVHVCACNTPDLFRVFSTRFAPLASPGAAGVAGLLVTSTLIEEAPVGERYQIAAFDERRFLHPDGLLLQCGGCRRMHVVGSSPRAWEFVPELLWRPPHNVSHSICGLCWEVYYGTELRRRAAP